jgi:uncharacterized protein YndB with AHSA1/START domain
VLERQVTLPASREEVWDALTDPSQVRRWFGADVDWDLRPGGAARFSSLEDERSRAGVVDAVTPAKTLRYRWWPEGETQQETEGEIEPASEVTYTLEDVPDGTRLTVTEQPLTRRAGVASAMTPARTASAAGAWLCPWDFRVLGLFVSMATRVPVFA